MRAQEERGGREGGKRDGEDLRQVAAKDSTLYWWSFLIAAPVGLGERGRWGNVEHDFIERKIMHHQWRFYHVGHEARWRATSEQRTVTPPTPRSLDPLFVFACSGPRPASRALPALRL